MIMTSNDPVNPQHYRNDGGIQLIELIRDLPFSIGNAIKYAYRHENKDGAAQDLKKAVWYLDDFVKSPSAMSKVIDLSVVEKVLQGVTLFESLLCLSLLDVYIGFQIDGVIPGVTAENVRSVMIQKIESLG